MILRSVLGCTAAAGVLMVSQGALAQGRAMARAPGPPPTPTAEKAALVELTGNWVSVIDQDWRWRMITPAKGDYQGVPLNPAGRRIAGEFNTALYGGADYQLSQIIDCRAYGAAALMHMPTRLRVSWENPQTLKLQTDWGEQTRRLHFIPDRPYADAQLPLIVQAEESGGTSRAPASAQGYSVALWEQPYDYDASAFSRGSQRRRGGGLGGALQTVTQPGGDLAVVTGDVAPGWLRRNGVPYGTHTRMIEHYQTFQDPTGAKWFDVATEVIDPEYLTAPFFTTGDFLQEPDGSKWAPHPCKQVAARDSGAAR